MQKTKCIATVILLATMVFAAVPSLNMIHAISQITNNHTSENKGANNAANYVKLADKAQEKIQNLIDLIYANQTALDKIEQAGLMDELAGNVTRFSQGVGNLTAAHEALNASDYQSAIANATEAFRIFKQVFVALHVILAKSEVEKGRLVDAQGLLEAMERSLEKIEKLRQMNLTAEAQELLNNATVYLNIETARIWLQEGRVNDVVENLTQAKKLIADVYKLLEKCARERNTIKNRVQNYLKGLNQTLEGIREKLHFAENQGFNVTAILERMGYQNMEQLQQHIQNMLEEAKLNIKDLHTEIQNLNRIGQTLREIDHDITRYVKQEHQKEGNNDQGGRP